MKLFRTHLTIRDGVRWFRAGGWQRWSVVLGVLLVAAQAQAQTNVTRALSLKQAIEMAVEHNLDVQFQSYQPLFDRYALQGIYGVYDVSFNARFVETHTESPASFSAPTGLIFPANKSDEEFATFGFGGVAPWGLNYELSEDITRTRGTRFTPAGLPVTIPPFYDNFAGVTLSQPLLRNFWIDRNRYDILISRKTIQLDELTFRQQVITTVTDTEQAYYNLIYAFENIKVQEKAVELAERLVAENKRKIEVGTMAPLDEAQAESQAAASRAALIAAKGQLQERQNALKNLLTDRYNSWHGVTIVPSERLLALPEAPDVVESWEKGMKMRPDLLQAKIDLERRDIDLRYRRNQLFPQLDVLGRYGRSGNGGSIGSSYSDIANERFPTYYYGAQISYPLSNRAARNAYRSSKAAIEQSKVDYKRTEQNVLVQIDNAVNTIRTEYQRVLATRRAREYAELALEAEQKKLEVGKSTSFEVLSLQSDLTSRRSEELRAVADYNIALSQLSLREGSTLERFHINVKSRQ